MRALNLTIAKDLSTEGANFFKQKSNRFYKQPAENQDATH